MKKKYKKGFVCSSFDLIHPGYILMLADAKSICDVLIAGLQINPNLSREWKNKPVQSIEERLIVLRSIKYIDEIYLYQTDEELINLLKLLSPDVRILGSEYTDKINEIVGRELIQIYYHKRNHNWSTTKLRNRIYNVERAKRKNNETI